VPASVFCRLSESPLLQQIISHNAQHAPAYRQSCTARKTKRSGGRNSKPAAEGSPVQATPKCAPGMHAARTSIS
jgi:hypothetical protein